MTSPELSPQSVHVSSASSSLSILFAVISLYGLAFGCILTVAGLFSGPHILIAGLAHIMIGIGFAVASFGVTNQRLWAYALGRTLSFGITAVGLFAVTSSLQQVDVTITIVWGFILLFFVLVTLAAQRAYRTALIKGQGNPSGRTKVA
ncbi:MAG: hypothetical protein ABJZ55_13500 [Fuerstiella sp.]